MGHASILRSITAFADIKYLDLQYWKPLHAAAAGGHSEAAQLLLQQYRMAVNQRCGKGYTPLHMAASTGQAQMVMLLLQACADVHAAITQGRTALHLAADGLPSEGRREVVQLLLQAGADVDVRTASNMTPLHCAASQDAVEVMQLLLQAGAVVEASSGRTTNCIRPLHCAALAGVVEAAKLLLRYGADINAAMNGGPTALTLALMKRHTAVVQLLLNKRARVSEDTLLYAAARAAPEDVLLVVAALGPAADAAMLSNASKAAAVASCMENAAVLLKLCLVDPAAVKGVMSGLQQPARAAAACVARWLAETRSLAKQQQRLDQQQRSIAAERLAVQQLVVAAAGTQQRVAAERKALEQRANDVASVHVEQLSGSEHAGNS
jgi:ankyrin repeat protein